MRILLFCALIASALIAAAGWYRGAVHNELIAEQTLERVARSFGQGGYEITLTGHNLVLPQWGGVDSGTITVGPDGTVAASLFRTGDGMYRVYRIGDFVRETFFARETCDQFARVPGGGPDVLAPFDLEDELRAATEIEFTVYGGEASGGRLTAPGLESPPDPPDIRARLPYLGVVTIVMPFSRIVGADFAMEIERLVDPIPPSTEPIVPTLGDRGPGGNPC